MAVPNARFFRRATRRRLTLEVRRRRASFKSKSLQKIHAYRWKYRIWTLLLCPNKNFQENQNITIAMLNLLGNTLIQSPCPKYGSGRNRCVESGLAIDASPVQINTAWLQWLIDGRANQFAKKTSGFC